MKRIACCFVLAAAVFFVACNSKQEDVQPNEVGRLLTPTGWENRLYSPGQVDVGTKDMDGRGNTLVVMQTSAFAVKESFLGAQANEDKEDHRVFTADKTPVSLDVRFMFTCPDYTTDPESVKRFFTLGNPVSIKDNDRKMSVSLASIYGDQAQLQVRGKIRDIIAGFKSFDDAFDHRGEINQQIAQILSKVLEERKVPLVLVDCQISNIKPDPLVWENQVKVQAADAEIAAMKKLQGYLDKNPTARMIFVMGKLKEISEIASVKGSNTIIFTGPLDGGTLDKTPLPLQTVRPGDGK